MVQIIVFLIVFLPLHAAAFLSDAEIASRQAALRDRPVADRIAFWAEQFVGTPYDTDPLGEYVRRKVIVADDRVDCMYHAFRTVELSVAETPEGAIDAALDKRFKSRGRTAAGEVLNYDERFKYGEDMIDSGKWGRELIREFGEPVFVKGSRTDGMIGIVPKQALLKNQHMLRNGDIVFFVTAPEKRHGDELVGHIGIIRKEHGEIYLIHAHGTKKRGGSVEKTLLTPYVRSMPFVGVRVSRMN